MLRNLHLLRRLSRVMLFCQDMRIFLRVLSENTEDSVWELKKSACVFEGGYVFRPPDGKIIGTYRDIELFRFFRFNNESCEFGVEKEDNSKQTLTR